MRLFDVAYCPGMACNLVSLRVLLKQGLHWDTKPATSVLRRHDGSVVCRLQDRNHQFVLEYLPFHLDRSAFYIRRNKLVSIATRPISKADFYQWHLRLGHPGADALHHLVAQAKGVKIRRSPDDEIRTTECEACAVCKIQQQINRTPRERPEKPGIRLATDFHDFREGHSFENSLMLVTDRYSGFSFDYYLRDRKSSTLGDMIADGLTKALSRDKWDRFLDQLNLTSTYEYHKSKRSKDEGDEGWEALEDTLTGGESGYLGSED
ncbi:hypothetical protein CHU98_g6757 [Xylaria longipes]|nr:hypothetical protein CHU98_g6757 [Xylaria longipes]